mmetsp:Transcript_34362/g.81829  ORF Transcript_34362/g.81829 Transcript_34362/m.81829 type:complete len:401 (+) Transcript_34362:113-1315(+)
MTTRPTHRLRSIKRSRWRARTGRPAPAPPAVCVVEVSGVERDGLGPRVRVDAPHHGLELLARAGLDVLRAAQRDEVLGALLPHDGLEELPLELLADLLDALVRLAGHVRVDLDRGHLDVRRVQSLRERLLRRLHEGRVEGAGDVEHLRLLGAERGGDLAHLLEHLEIARARAPLGEHVVCDVGLLAAAHRGRRLVEGLLQRRVRRAGDGRHASGRSLRGGVHGLGARLDDPQAVLEGERAAEDERRVLAEREAGGALDLLEHVGRLLLGLLHRGEAADEDGRLRVEGRVELLLRSLGAEADHIVAEDLARELEEALHRRALEQLARHAHLLRALPREEHGHVALGLGRVGPRLGRGGLLRGELRLDKLLRLLALLLLLEEGLRADPALLHVRLVVRRLAW